MSSRLWVPLCTSCAAMTDRAGGHRRPSAGSPDRWAPSDAAICRIGARHRVRDRDRPDDDQPGATARSGPRTTPPSASPTVPSGSPRLVPIGLSAMRFGSSSGRPAPATAAARSRSPQLVGVGVGAGDRRDERRRPEHLADAVLEQR